MRTAGQHKRGRFNISGKRRLYGLVGLLGALGAVALLVTVLPAGNDSDAARPATTTTEKAPNGANPSSISVIPDSISIAKAPAKPTTGTHAAKPRGTADRTGANAPGSTGTAPGTAAGSSAGGAAESGPITAGDSRANCITLSFPSGVLNQSTINAATSLTGITYNCINTYANPVQSWAEWETPWMFSTASDGWDAWLAQSSTHQVIVGMDLIPQTVANSGDPLTWEESCASGSYNQYATVLATNLVSYGAGHVVIRLGVEANGTWEDDYVGSTDTEMSDWAHCFDNEVAAMRAVPGADFLFVWNPNVCANDLPLNEWYPGNSYVDIIGVDAYDKDCLTLKTVSQEGWSTYSNDSSGNTPNDPNFPSLDNIKAFAAANGKSLSFPEWAIYSGTSDDPTYVADMAQIFNDGDFSYECYYDTGGAGVAMLGSAIPNATATYTQVFK
jgi:hypothetical protein